MDLEAFKGSEMIHSPFPGIAEPTRNKLQSIVHGVFGNIVAQAPVGNATVLGTHEILGEFCDSSWPLPATTTDPSSLVLQLSLG